MSSAEIAGRYRLERRLGFGGMSTVHLALDLRLERQVAVKLLAEHLADDPAFVSRFQREAQAAARLVHPNIVQVFDSGPRRAHRPVLHRDGVHRGLLLRGDPARRRLGGGRRGAVDHRTGLRGPRLRPPPRRRPPRRQARQPAALARRRGQARRLRDRQGDRAVEHHPGRLRARHRRLPRPRAGPRRGGRPERRPLRARRRHLPADLRPPALRGHLAHRARAQAAAGGAAHARHARRRRQPRARRRRRDRAGARPARPLPDRHEMRRGAARRRPRASRRSDPAGAAAARRRPRPCSPPQGAAGVAPGRGAATRRQPPRRRARRPRQGPPRSRPAAAAPPPRSPAPTQQGRGRLVERAARAARARCS